MAQPQISDNIDVGAPKATDDREGVFQSGVWRAYTSLTEASAKTANRRFINMTVPIRITGVDIKHRWNGTTWVPDDAILANENAIEAQQTVLNLSTGIDYNSNYGF